VLPPLFWRPVRWPALCSRASALKENLTPPMDCNALLFHEGRSYSRRRGYSGAPDDETVRRARELFEERRQSFAYDGFEVWDLARMVFQYPARRSTISLETADRLIACLGPTDSRDQSS
jgi:hypothetical protein